MPCGVTKNGVVCDNPGTSSHTGPHSGIKTLWGYSLRLNWYNTDAVPVVLKRALPGIRARSDQGLLQTGGTVQLTASGMDLTVRYTCTSGWAKPTGWAARSGFTNVEIEDNALIMNGPGNVRIHVRGDASAAAFATVSKRILKNGTVLQTWNDVENDHTVDTSVVAGDTLHVEFSASGGWSASYIEANSGTYLYTEII